MASRITFKDTTVRLDATSMGFPMAWMLRKVQETAPPLVEDTVVITSVNDGRHKRLSLHYDDLAVDVRYRGDRVGGAVLAMRPMTDRRPLENVVATDWAIRLRKALGSHYDVVVEGDHIHVEYDV